MPPVIDGKYKVVRLLGEGGMGAVFEARHMGTGRRVALKVMIPEVLAHGGDLIARFQREARAAGAIESPHIAQVMDSGIDRETGSPFMVMEMLSGEDVGQAIERLGPLPPDVCLRIVAQACIGLAKAHDAHVVHRDIKPANLYLATQDDGSVVLKLLDFGIAKMKQDQTGAGSAKLTSTGSLVGSPLYMSPEQVRGLRDIDARTDLWSLGVVLYEALCGSTPHGHHDALGAIMIAICGEAAPAIQTRAPWVPPAVASVVHRALSLDPIQRFASAAEMLGALRALLPNGHALDVHMLTGVSQEVRSQAPAPQPPALSAHDLATLAATSTTYRDLKRPGPLPVPPPGAPNRWPMFIALGALAAVVALGSAAGIVKLRGHGAHAASDPIADPSVASGAPHEDPVVTSAAASVPAAVSSVVPVPSTSAAARTGAVVTTAPAVIVRPRPGLPSASPPSPAGATPAVSAAVAAPTPPRPQPTVTCDPPYTINSAGHHVLKPECQ